MSNDIWDLKPCPFCGNQNSLELLSGQRDVKKIYYVHCMNCDCYGAVGTTENAAISKWNWRKPDRDRNIAGVKIA